LSSQKKMICASAGTFKAYQPLRDEIWPSLWMRSSRVDRASAWPPMPKSQQSWIRSQHPPTQWNLGGGRWSSAEYST
jgi:hypothetical protein